MFKRWGMVLFLGALLTGMVLYLKENSVHAENHELFAVGVTTENGEEEEIECWKNPNTGGYYVFLPSYGAENGYRLCLNPEETLELSGKELTGNTALTEDLLKLGEGQPFELEDEEGGTAAEGTLTFLRSSQLAALYIDTDSESMEEVEKDKQHKEGGSYRLVEASGEENADGKISYIKGRGNSTWEWSKKPYRLELAQPEGLLGMGESSSWVLLANYNDNSYIRNKIIYDLAEEIGLEASPKSEFVDLYLNGVYAGLYQLSEKIQVSDQRLSLSDGCLMEWEIDARAEDEDNSFQTKQGQTVLVLYPKGFRNSEWTELTGFVQEFEDALYDEDGVNAQTGKSLEDYIDLESWAKKYMIEEISKNHDGGISSQYFYLKREDGQERLYAGPVWDYDGALGNGDWSIRKPEGLLINQDIRIYNPTDPENVFRNRWFAELCKREAFQEETEEQYQRCVRAAVQEVIDTKIDGYLQQIADSARMDAARWAGEAASMQRIYRETLEEHGDYLKNFLERRLAFLDTVWIDKVDYCTVCFHTEYGSRNFFYQVEPGKVVENPPSYEESFGGYVFMSWYYDEAYTDPFDPERPITADTDVYAKWIEE